MAVDNGLEVLSVRDAAIDIDAFRALRHSFDAALAVSRQSHYADAEEKRVR